MRCLKEGKLASVGCTFELVCDILSKYYRLFVDGLSYLLSSSYSLSYLLIYVLSRESILVKLSDPMNCSYFYFC